MHKRIHKIVPCVYNIKQNVLLVIDYSLLTSVDSIKTTLWTSFLSNVLLRVKCVLFSLPLATNHHKTR
jgi:hypothetical protein